jgi:hypothetical protein
VILSGGKRKVNQSMISVSNTLHLYGQHLVSQVIVTIDMILPNWNVRWENQDKYPLQIQVDFYAML